MPSDRWHRIDEVWQSALQLDPDRRSEFVRDACAGDETLRAEIESLLNLERDAGEFLEPPVVDQDPVEVGSTIDHYRVIEKIGIGGMGVVYKAEDLHLSRAVALKFLSYRLSRDKQAFERLQREARAASALNHPNIVTIHDIASHNNRDFIVMEYVEGKSLAQLTGGRHLPPDVVLRYAIHIAEALEKAHAKGIIHRDLKPGNVMVTDSGTVKVLDFGLAKLAPAFPDERGRVPAASGSIDSGSAAGTPPYMAPEQIAGQPADERSDIFCLGALLYEMATGRPAFSGWLRAEPPPVHSIAPDTPAGLERVISRCLRPNPPERFQHAGEVKCALEEVAREQQGPVPSIAVLPFVNLSADRENEYFSDGLAEEIMNSLSGLPGLRVVARSSAFAFRGRDFDIREVGAELRASHVLEGSVRKSGNRIRVSVRLVNVADGYDLWSERFDREMVDVFDIQDEISQAIVQKLRVQLFGKPPLVQRHTANPEAYNLYLAGHHLWFQYTSVGWEKAIEYFQKAIAKDPDYAPPHAALTYSWLHLAYNGWVRPLDVLPDARRHALRALELDESLAEAHFAVGAIRECEWDWSGAETEFLRAIELNPAEAYIRVQYALLLANTGRADEALAAGRQAVDLEPISVEVNRVMIYLCYVVERYDEALERGRRMVELHPYARGVQGVFAMACTHKGLYSEAIQILQETIALAGDDPLYHWHLGYTYACAGRKAEAMEIVDRLERRSRERYYSPTYLAWLYGALGELDRAFELVDLGFAEHDLVLVTLKTHHPVWRPFRSDPRYPALLKRIGLES